MCSKYKIINTWNLIIFWFKNSTLEINKWICMFYTKTRIAGTNTDDFRISVCISISNGQTRKKHGTIIFYLNTITVLILFVNVFKDSLYALLSTIPRHITTLHRWTSVVFCLHQSYARRYATMHSIAYQYTVVLARTIIKMITWGRVETG